MKKRYDRKMALFYAEFGHTCPYERCCDLRFCAFVMPLSGVSFGV